MLPHILVLAALNMLTVASPKNSPGCTTPLPPNLIPGGASQVFTIPSKSQIGTVIQRRYSVYLPQRFSANNSQPAPLILAFHGQTQPLWSIEAITNFSEPWFNRDAVVVYPEGVEYQAPGHQWLGDPMAPPSTILDDRIFVTELLDHIPTILCIDTSRIYAAGLSNGGGLVGLLACSQAHNSRIAAFAGVAAAFYTDASLSEPLFGRGCRPGLRRSSSSSSRAVVPILEMHGVNDSIIAYNGSNAPDPDTIPLPEWTAAWARREGCASKRPKLGVLDGGNTTRYAWSCRGKQDVLVHYRIGKFGHGWPGTVWQGEPFERLRLGPTTWNATGVILEWFDRWMLDGKEGDGREL